MASLLSRCGRERAEPPVGTRYTTSAHGSRAGRLFIDYLCSGRGTTAIGAYSPRANRASTWPCGELERFKTWSSSWCLPAGGQAEEKLEPAVTRYTEVIFDTNRESPAFSTRSSLLRGTQLDSLLAEVDHGRRSTAADTSDTKSLHLRFLSLSSSPSHLGQEASALLARGREPDAAISQLVMTNAGLCRAIGLLFGLQTLHPLMPD